MMRRVLLASAVAAGCLLAAAAVRASYLEWDQGGREPEPPVRILPPPEPMPPIRDNPLARFVRRLTVLPGYTYDGLTVFQLETSRIDDETDYLSMGAAPKRGDLALREKGSGSVPTLEARNSGRDHVLLLAGEVVTGGKQNRVLQYDVLLVPRSGWIELPVLCVEQGRWQGKAGFEASPSVAMLGLRVNAQTGAAQERIWADVAGYSRDLGVSSPTQDLQDVQGSSEVREAVGRYRDEFGRRWRREAVGMVVARYGRIVGADVFCNAEVFLKHRDRLLESYAADCWLWRRRQPRLPMPGEPAGGVGPGEAERFIRRALRAHCEERPGPGAGRVLDVSGAGIRGTGLAHRGALLHAALFPWDEPVIQPLEPPIRRPFLPEPLPRPPLDEPHR